MHFMRGSRKICQKGSNSENVFVCFLVEEERKDPNTTISGPSLARQRNAVMDDGPIHSIWLGSFMIVQGIWTSVAKKPNMFAPLNPRMYFLSYHGYSQLLQYTKLLFLKQVLALVSVHVCAISL